MYNILIKFFLEDTVHKFSKLRILKALYAVFSLLGSYIVSAIFSSLVVFDTLDGFFGYSLFPLIIGGAASIALVFIFKLHSTSFRNVSINEIVKLGLVASILLILNAITLLIARDLRACWGWALMLSAFFFVSASLAISIYRLLLFVKFKVSNTRGDEKPNVLIVGAGSAGTMILREIQSSDKINYRAVGFLDDAPAKLGSTILGVRVLGTTDDVEEIVRKHEVKLIIIAIPGASAKVLKDISAKCVNAKCEVKTLPGLYQLVDGQVSVSKLRNVDVNDLLGRDPVHTNLDEVAGYIENKVVLVTGGGGSIGSELCRQIANYNPKQLIILDIYENNAYDIEQELKRKMPNLNLLTLIASVRDSKKMDNVFSTYRPNIVFHAAAHKHVPLMETSPNEAVKNNVIGTYKVVRAADKYGVEKFVQISTDKAVNPTNIMGATKRICEMIIQAYAKRSKTCFVAVRFGNVLGSNGSVIPLFKKQIAEGGPITLTHPDIIRYFMTIPEAVSLVLQAGASANGGEIFVLDMGEQVKIYDLAVNLIKLSGYEPFKDIDIKITGLRPGEKLYEERLMAEEGLTKTANDKISIGKPLDIDEDKLFATLDKLYSEAYKETDKMKELVKELVPTYQIDKRQ
ncbi:MAG: polysaccharide biosynthesis protein [Clostridia bacterium]|nr:polysaccharide biosynthesis protein [Clostridia bacterium]